MLIFGGTNDLWIDAPVGNLEYSAWTEDELKCVLPAFCYLLDKAKKVVGEIIVILNTDLKFLSWKENCKWGGLSS